MYLLGILMFYLTLVVESRSSLGQQSPPEFLAHLMNVQNFACREPQKRAIPLSTLKALPAEEQYYPAVTVLHRCDGPAGWCAQGEGYGCVPAATENVSLVFQVLNKMRTNRRAASRATRYETIIAVNHTLCECQMLSDTPK